MNLSQLNKMMGCVGLCCWVCVGFVVSCSVLQYLADGVLCILFLQMCLLKYTNTQQVCNQCHNHVFERTKICITKMQ